MDGPQNQVGAGIPNHQDNRPTTNNSHTNNPTSIDYTGQPRQRAFDALVSRSYPTRRHAYAWREGFGYGFRDALRLASRHIDDPHVLAILAELAEYYDLAGAE